MEEEVFDLMQILRIESDLADLEPYLPSLINQGWAGRDFPTLSSRMS